MDRKTLVNISLLVVFLLCVGVWQVWTMVREVYPIVNFPPREHTIVALGDSLTVGIGASSPDKSFVSQLEHRLGITITNKGVSGDTTEQALARLDHDVLALRPGVVLILLGGNDIIARVPKETTFANLKTIIDRTHASGAAVVLVGIDDPRNHSTLSDFKALARKTGCFYVPDILGEIIDNPALISDEIHPNDAGYLKVADKIAPTLEGIATALQSNNSTDQGSGTVRTSPSLE